MDIDMQNIVKLIYPEGVPDVWKDNPEFYSYLSKLGSYSVEKLNKEPERLVDEKSAVLLQTQELAICNYKTFIQTAECSREIFEQFKTTEDRLESLLHQVPAFISECEEFARSCNDIRSRRRLNSLSLSRHGQMLQVLEVPLLMDTVVRDGHYEEALQLAAHVRRLGRLHIPVVVRIVEEVERSWVNLMHQLLAGLSADLQLPRCLQIVGYLRRMEVLSEPELRLKFLQARDAWLLSLLSDIPNQDANHHLSKTIELSRTHLFNIVTQYRAAFSSDSSASVTANKHAVDQASIFYSWINEKILQFVLTLEEDLDRGVGPSLSSLLGQCMYFGHSFSRVGADFRALLAPVFVCHISNSLASELHSASGRFRADMEKFTLARVNAVQPAKRSAVSEKDTKQDHPPEGLLQFYPLASYCNNLLTALNNLRLCAPLAVADSATNDLTESLSSAADTILGFYKREQQALSETEKEALMRFCMCFADQLVPYVQRCLQAIYRPADIATHLGVSTYQLQEQGLTYLDQTRIVEPISHLLPQKLDLSSSCFPSDAAFTQSAYVAPETTAASNKIQASTVVAATKEHCPTVEATVTEEKSEAMQNIAMQ